MAGKSTTQSPYASTSGRAVCLCPECKGHGYDPDGIFHNGGLRRPCRSCLLAGFVYLDTGEPLSETDAIAVMRQALNRMSERIGYLSNRPSTSRRNDEQHFGVNHDGYRGD